MFNYITTNPLQTKKLGEILARESLKTKDRKTALVIGLEGDLGGGKTTFLQGFAKELKIKEKILSPTFVIMKKFEIPQSVIGNTYNTFYHIDCYRIKKTKELLALRFKEIVSNPKNIITIEWADMVQKMLPKTTIILKFKFIDQKTRKITIQ